MKSFGIACGHDVTAEACEGVLRAGGTAVDAAISGALTAMVCEPVLAGLLGGGFLTVRAPRGDVSVLDAFVKTPGRKRPGGDLDFRAIHADFGTTRQEFHIGAGAIASPGIAPGLVAAHERFGRMPFRDLVHPALSAARDGVDITPFQGELSRIVAPILTATPAAQALFCDDEAPKPGGSRYRNPEFADVLEVFAAEGLRFVTEGEVAQALLSLTGEGGHLTAADLTANVPAWRVPLNLSRGAARISLNPPPSLGGVLTAFGLQVLPHRPDEVAVVRCLEATCRARVEAALDTDASTGAETILSEPLLETYRRQIKDRVPATRGTTHISVIDSEGMGAALTLSNGEGCGLIAPGTGIMPNNMLGEADLLPNGFDAWTPDQRLSSMMCPMAVEWPDGRFAMLGSGGSNRIRSALLQVLLGVVDRGDALTDAIHAPRAHVEVDGTAQVDFEDILGERVRESILTAYPEATPWPDHSMFFGGVHAVARDPRGGVDATGDPRRAGCARFV